MHCVKSVRIQSYSGSHFPAFGLNTTERYSVSLRIQSECGKMRTRITPTTDAFHDVILVYLCLYLLLYLVCLACLCLCVYIWYLVYLCVFSIFVSKPYSIYVLSIYMIYFSLSFFFIVSNHIISWNLWWNRHIFFVNFPGYAVLLLFNSH